MTQSKMGSSDPQSARSAILNRLEKKLTTPDHAAHREVSIENLKIRGVQRYSPSHLTDSRDQLIEQMQQNLIATNAEVHRSISLADVPSFITSLLTSKDLPLSLHIGSDSVINALDWQQSGVSLSENMPVDEGAVSLTRSIAGAAETGTLFFVSGKDNPAAHNFTATTHIALIDEATIFSTYEQAFDLIRQDNKALPRSVMMISGPSRTADIEQTLSVGAHGPTTLLVLIYN